jgi:peptide-methionine (S)-S-oxide reductase
VVLLARGRAPTALGKTPVPDPAFDEPLAASSGTETMVVAGGCFWGVQAVFQHVKGVVSATSGYAGGTARTAQYEVVSSGRTGHAESVRITYDPSRISYGQLLKIFFTVAHAPTQLNGRAPTSDRSAARPCSSPARNSAIAKAYVDQLDAAKVFRRASSRRSTPARLYEAEAYHQDYFTRPPTSFIVVNDRPKVRRSAAVSRSLRRARVRR